MELLIFLLFSIISINLGETSINIPQLATSDKKLYRLTPVSMDQVILLHYIRESEFGVSFSKRIEKMGDSVDFLSAPSLIQDINQKFSDLNLDISEVSPTNATIILDNLMKNEKHIMDIMDCDKKRKSTAGSSEKLMGISKINGTELFTGIFYKVGMKRFPEGWLTWTAETNGDKANFIQVDLNPEHWPHYATGGSYQYDNQWSFGETEDPGWYTFTNRGVPKGLANWSNAKRGSGNQLILSTKPEHITLLSKGGDWRKDAMWAPMATNQENYYSLTMKQFPRGVVTWTNQKYGDFSHYIIVATKESDMIHYQPQGQWHADAMFKFEPTGLALEARVYSFQFRDGVLQDFLNNGSVIAKQAPVFEIDHPNESSSDEIYTMDEIATRENTFSFEFKEPRLKMIAKAKLQVSLPMAADCVEVSFQQGSSGVNQHRKVIQTQTTRILVQIKIPRLTMLTASVDTEYVEGLKIPFTAKMEITGTADRLMADGSGRGSTAFVPSAVLHQFLKSSTTADNLKIVDQTNDALTIAVSGTLTASFGIRTILKCSSCHVDFLVLQQSSFFA